MVLSRLNKNSAFHKGRRLSGTLSSSSLSCTNINHKGLQRTANEYAEERRIYKDVISLAELVFT